MANGCAEPAAWSFATIAASAATLMMKPPAGRYYAAAVVTQLEGQQSSVDKLDVLIAWAGGAFDLADSEQKVIGVRID